MPACGRPIPWRARYARAIASEMHAGFVPMRRHLPMNMWRPVMPRELPEDVAANVRRIEHIWTDCRTRFGSGGPFLFGRFGAADAMYAPVVSRFHTYAVEVGPVARDYMKADDGACRHGSNGALQQSRSRGSCRKTKSTGRRYCASNVLSIATKSA